MQTFSPADLDPGQRYKLMSGSIIPRPIGWISTVSADGATNLAPYSFFNGVSANPMCVQFCPANKSDGSPKDSLANALPEDEGGTGEFVANIVSEHLANQMAATAEPLAPGESEFALAGLAEAPGEVVRVPRVADALVAFECRTMQVIQLAQGQPGGGNLVLGEVIKIHVADGLVNDRFHVDTDKLAAVGRIGGLTYARTMDRFDLPTGAAALDATATSN
ncbi:MAG: flavin reductase family protein [Planctomycetota bacterium]